MSSFLRQRNSSIPKLINWLMSVAIAAPPIPNLKANINIGSSIILSIPPNDNPSIEKNALPCDLIMLLSTNEEHINGVPINIYIE